MKKLLVCFAVIVGIGYTTGACLDFASAETVNVMDRGPVDLSPFRCEWIRSSFVERVCYDSRENSVVVKLAGTYYQFCGVPPGTVADWLRDEAKDRFYDANVKGRFDCGSSNVPSN